MTIALCVLGYIVCGAFSLGIVVANRVANDVAMWDDPMPLAAFIAWPAAMPCYCAWTIAARMGAEKRRRVLEEKRLLKEAGFDD